MTSVRSSAADRGWLDPSASGLRHLRWAREVLGSIGGHLALLDDGELSDAGHGRAVPHDLQPSLASAHRELAEAVAHLSAAVKAYRDLLERRRTEVRGLERALAAWRFPTGGRLAAFDASERAPRRSDVRAEVRRLRETMANVLAQLERYPDVHASLLPPLADAHHVAGDGDPDDDATA